MEPIVSSETSEIRTQTPGNYPKRNKLQWNCCVWWKFVISFWVAFNSVMVYYVSFEMLMAVIFKTAVCWGVGFCVWQVAEFLFIFSFYHFITRATEEICQAHSYTTWTYPVHTACVLHYLQCPITMHSDVPKISQVPEHTVVNTMVKLQETFCCKHKISWRNWWHKRNI